MKCTLSTRGWRRIGSGATALAWGALAVAVLPTPFAFEVGISAWFLLLYAAAGAFRRAVPVPQTGLLP